MPIAEACLGHALTQRAALAAEFGDRRLLVFLDYDGTLSPIVARPQDAVLAADMRAALTALAARHPVAVVSGRQLADVRERVGLPGLYYAGNHGFEIAGPPPDGLRWEVAAEYVDALDAFRAALAPEIEGIDGVLIEHKRYSLSIHYRLVDPARVPGLIERVEAATAAHPRLRLRRGKCVLEIRPDLDWHKG